MQHSRIGRCAVSTRDLMNNTHARLVRVLFRHWHFCSVYTACNELRILEKSGGAKDNMISRAFSWLLAWVRL